MRIFAALVIALAGLCGCGNGTLAPDAAPPDAAADAPVDAPVPVDSGPCGDDFLFTGAYVDWDSSDANFRGVASAQVIEQSDPGNTATTAPNGRATLCLPADSLSLVTFQHPDYLELSYAAEPAIDSLGAFEIKGLTPARMADLYASDFNQAPSAQAGTVQVAVYLYPDQVPAMGVQVDMTTPHSGAYINDGTGTYIEGNIVTHDPYIIFPNVMSATMVELQVTAPAGITCLVPNYVITGDGGVGAATVACMQE